MTEKDKKIEDEELEGVSGGKAYWEGKSVRFSSEEGDWRKGDKFEYNPPNELRWEYIVLTDNGMYIDSITGHKYNGKRYILKTNEFCGDITITDYDIMMRKWDLKFIK